MARALALLGMVIVNYRTRMEANESGPDVLAWLVDRIEGRAAALFVVLAGLGVSLRSRRARAEPARYLAFERRALVERAVVVFLVGLLHLHYWEWDILHCYGPYLVIAALLLAARDAVLLALAAFFTVGAVVLQAQFDYEQVTEMWTFVGFAKDLWFNGLHPIFPWMSFLLVGMWVGRRNLNDRGTRRRLLLAAIALTVVAEAVDSVAYYAPELLGLDEYSAYWLSSGPRPARPGYVVAAGGAAVASLCACVAVTKDRARQTWVVYLTATGQMAFTLYLAHTLAIVIPQQHEVLDRAPLLVSFFFALAFYVVAVAASVWWRARFAQGPIEAFIRQVTGRTSPAPWGGVRLSELPPAPAAVDPPPGRPGPASPTEPERAPRD